MPHRSTARGKRSYTVTCSSAFRAAVEDLARRRGVNVADLARSAFLSLDRRDIEAFADPGEPAASDRDVVLPVSGGEDASWRRKPRLQARLMPGLDGPLIRKALALMLALDAGDRRVRVMRGPDTPADARVAEQAAKAAVTAAAIAESQAEIARLKADNETHRRRQKEELERVRDELERLHAIVNVLAFEPLPRGIETRADALHVLGFAPGARPTERQIKARFRMLATIHHPDSSYGSHDRMSQLNTAVAYLRSHPA